jgi:hypothetical protein
VLEIRHPEKDQELENRLKKITLHQLIYDGSNTQKGTLKQIENGFIQGAVLSFTLFSVAMTETTHGIAELIKIIGYADDWIIHNTHKHERVCVLSLQKAMDKIVRSAFKSRLKKQKPSFSVTKQDWTHGVKIEQVSQHKILGLIFGTRMN